MILWLSLITALARAAAAFLEARAVGARWALAKDIEETAVKYENEIARLRALGDDDAADRMRNRWLRLNGVASKTGDDLPASHPDA